MNRKGKKSINYIMRALHRDIAFITIGFTIVYALSGMLLVYRNTDFLKSEKNFEKTIEKNLKPDRLGQELGIRGLKVEKEENGVMFFKQGVYNATTGETKFSKKVYPLAVEKLVDLHKMNGKNKLHWVSTAYGAMLFFLAFSAFFMYNKGSSLRRRSFAMVGLSVGILLLVIYIL